MRAFVVLLVVALATVVASVEDDEILALFSMNESPELGFSWSSCGSSSDPATVSALSVLPGVCTSRGLCSTRVEPLPATHRKLTHFCLLDPVDISKTATEDVTVSGAGSLKVALSAPIKVDLELHKKVLGVWTKVIM